MSPPNDLQLPDDEHGIPPTVEGLAAEMAAMRRRLARLESRTGNTTDETLLDLAPQEALSLLGGASARLEDLMAEAKRKRATGGA